MTSVVTNWKSASASLLLVGMMLLSTWVGIFDINQKLDDTTKIQRITASDSLTMDTQTNSSLPSNTYGSAQNLMIGDAEFTSAKILASFDLTGTSGTLQTTSVVESASISLHCQRFSQLAVGGTTIYPAMLLANYSESNANHNESDTGVNWNVSGADGLGVDRDQWEPGTSVTISSSATVEVNITALVQDALRDGKTNMSIILSAVGQPIYCSSSEHTTTAFRPSVDFVHSIGIANTQGSVNVDGPLSGSILSDESQLAIRPNLHPTVSWSNMTGNGLEIQFSNGNDFRAVSDGDWVWNSWDDSSSFSMNNFEFDTPNSNLSGGSWVFFRMRTTNDTILGPWSYGGHFGLPASIGTVDLNNVASIELGNDSIGLGFGTVHDTWMLSGNSSYNGEQDFRYRVGHSNSSTEQNMEAIFKLNMGTIPLHQNVTIEDATLNIRRTGRTGAPVISVWVLDSSGHVMSELNWDNSSNGVAWNAQERVTEFGNLVGSVDGNQSYATLSWDISSVIQNYLRTNQQGDIDFLITGYGLAGEEIEFASGDIDAPSYRPHVDIDYTWGDNSATALSSSVQPDGRAAWDVSSWSLVSTLTPTLSWNVTYDPVSNSANDVIIELIPGGSGPGEEVMHRVDSRTNGGFDLANGEFTIPSNWGLGYGEWYSWRIQSVENDERSNWYSTKLLVSKVNSSSLGNGDHELRLSHGNGTLPTSQQSPECGDTTLESGLASSTNLDNQDLTASSTQVILIGCDLPSHQLPDGMAVVSATLRMRTHQYSGISTFPVSLTLHESSEHNWDESAATWNTTDGVTPWNGVGASGTERVMALESVDIEYDSTWYEWNVTGAVQSAMRSGVSADFIMTSTSSTSVTFYDHSNVNHPPELVIIYTNGSNAAPNVPIDMTPSNGDWILSGDYTFTVDQTPTLSWNETGATVANGWQIQVDGDSGFGSNSLLTFSSWIDTSSFSGTSFTFANDLSEGEEFYWRARGISATGQIGLWSVGTSFVIPDLDVYQIDSDTYKVNMGHGDILSDGSMPLFTDTWISWAPSSLNDTHASDDTLFISGTSSALIEIPIDGIGALPSPANAKLVSASISFHVSTNNSSTPSIAIYETLQDWNSSSTGLAYDGTTNWSSLGGSGIQDRSEWIDVVIDQAASVRMVLDISEIVQAAMTRGDDSVGLMLSVEANSNDRIVLASTETQFDANEPELSLTWQNGTATPPTQAATIVSPANSDILWDFPSMSAEDNPVFTWSHPAASNVTDWRLFEYYTNDGPWAGLGVVDSRECGSTCIFDMTNMSLSFPSVWLDQDEEYSWIIQPIQDGMYGPRSSVEDFIIPNDIGDAVNSTDYWVDLSNGNAHAGTGSYDVTQGAYIDSCTPNTAFGSFANYLPIGSSNGGPGCTNAGHESRSLLNFNISNVPIMDGNPWQVAEATVELYRWGGSSSYTTSISVSDTYCDWVEASVTWNDCATNNSWQTSGAYGVNDAGVPVSVTDVSTTGWYSWDVTPLLQQARWRGTDVLNLLFASEDPNLIARHSFIHEDATGSYLSYRPVLNITYRAGSQSVPSSPTWDSSLTTNGPFTSWDSSSLRPIPLNPLNSVWTHPSASTIDSWEIQHALDERFTDSSRIYDSSDSSTWLNSTFDITNLTMLTPSSEAQGDHWNHLRIRAVRDGVYSNWSAPFQTRVPDEQGSDDGAGNYTVTMQRGVVFTDSGLLPSMPDTWIGSNAIGQTQNHGAETTIKVGVDPGSSGHDAVGLVSIDLTEYPYPSTMLPTSVTLRMYVASITGTGAHSISIHDCASFTESTTTWGNFNPNTQCNGTASSSMTSTSTNAGVWYEWDVTGIARSAWLGSGVMSMALKSSWAGTISLTSAEGSTTYAPELEVEYVDNPNNASSPVQVSLVSPEHLEVVYDVNGQYTLGVDTRPALIWNGLSDATGYVLILSNESGSQTYQSWDSNSNSGFIACSSQPASTCSWQPTFDLAVGEIYTWSIQALNGSVPGPRSVPWTFGIGNPDITYVGNHVHTIKIEEGADVEDLGHVPIWDTHISEGAPSTAHGSENLLQIGNGCDSGSTNRCYGLYEVDMGLMGALDLLSVNPHSASLSVYVQGIADISGANYLDLTAYAIINPNYEESGATWDSATTGVNWNQSGMQSGIDYSNLPLDTVRVMGSFTGGWITFDVSGAMTTMNGTVSILIIGTPNSGNMLLEVRSSECSLFNCKPKLEFNYTSVDSISISGPSSTDADTAVSFSGNLLDSAGGTLAGDLIWTSSSGSIDSNGLFTPDQTGIVQITASFGQVSVMQNITVSAGAPLTLIVTPLVASLTTDDVFELGQVKVIDANGNVVPGEVITLGASNGTIVPGTTVTTPVSGVSWVPWTTGQQFLNISWQSQTISIPITVTVGVPDYFEIFGDSTIEAGNSSTYDFTIHDWRGNQMDRSNAGPITWGAVNGDMDNSTGTFTGDSIGEWTIWVEDSYWQISSTFIVTVNYGDIDDLKVIAIGPNTIIVTSTPTTSKVDLTADESVTFTTIRIDVKGNEETVFVPLSSWSSSDELSVFSDNSSNYPIKWDASKPGLQTVTVSLEGVSVTIPMNVEHGIPVRIEADADQTTLASADPREEIESYAFDADENRWPISAEEWSFTNSNADPEWLEHSQGTYTFFYPVTEGTWEVELRYTDSSIPMTFYDSIEFIVVPGVLSYITVAEDAIITADETHDLGPTATDENYNTLPVDGLYWYMWDNSNSQSRPSACSISLGWDDITDSMRSDSYVWNASLVGTYTICAIGGSGSAALPAMSEVEVVHGEIASVWHSAYIGYEYNGEGESVHIGEVENMQSTSIIAGMSPFVTLSVMDSDGNVFFPWDVTWTSNSVEQFSEGDYFIVNEGIGYTFLGTKNQTFDLEYSVGDCTSCTGIWTVNIAYAELASITAVASASGVVPGDSISVEQQTTITITATGADQFGNPVPISLSSLFSSDADSNLNAVTRIDDTTYEVYMLNEGPNSITVMDGVVSDTVEVNVDGTIAGFFEANSPLSWIGLGVVVFLLIGVVVVIAVIVRRAGDSDDEYDDDMEYPEDDYNEMPISTPDSEPTESEPAGESDDYNAEDDPNYRVDEDGTEWWEDDDGTWWYRDSGMEDWAEWTE